MGKKGGRADGTKGAPFCLLLVCSGGFLTPLPQPRWAGSAAGFCSCGSLFTPFSRTPSPREGSTQISPSVGLPWGPPPVEPGGLPVVMATNKLLFFQGSPSEVLTAPSLVPRTSLWPSSRAVWARGWGWGFSSAGTSYRVPPGKGGVLGLCSGFWG